MAEKKSKKIGFDLDDVLMSFSDSLREHFNLKYNKNVKRSDITSFYVEEFFDIDPTEARKAIDDFYHHEDHAQALPLEGSLDSIKKLSINNKLYIVTARPDLVKEITQKWLDKHFPNLFETIQYTNHHDKEKRRKKSEVAKELEIEIFIDDSLDNAKDISESGIPVLLFDTPWNQTEELPELVTRVYSWEEIFENLNK